MFDFRVCYSLVDQLFHAVHSEEAVEANQKMSIPAKFAVDEETNCVSTHCIDVFIVGLYQEQGV